MDQKIAQLYDEGKVEQAIHLLIKKIDQHPQKIFQTGKKLALNKLYVGLAQKGAQFRKQAAAIIYPSVKPELFIAAFYSATSFPLIVAEHRHKLVKVVVRKIRRVQPQNVALLFWRRLDVSCRRVRRRGVERRYPVEND